MLRLGTYRGHGPFRGHGGRGIGTTGVDWGKRSDRVVLPVAAKFPPLQTLTSSNLPSSSRFFRAIFPTARPVCLSSSSSSSSSTATFVLFCSLPFSPSLDTSSSLFFARNLARAVCPFLVRNISREFRSSPKFNFVAPSIPIESLSLPVAAPYLPVLYLLLFFDSLLRFDFGASFQPADSDQSCVLLGARHLGQHRTVS